MSKVLKVANGNYKIQVEPGGEITLNTGPSAGIVRVTGDLLVEGTTTTVNTANLDIQDNIILLNQGEQGDGVTEGTSGLRIDRGNFPDALFVFDESIPFNDPITETTKFGAWVSTDINGATVALRTNSIATGGGDLYLINSGSGVISVSGTNNYENNVVDDDHIPNRKFVIDFVNFTLSNVFQPAIGDGILSPTTVTASDIETTGQRSEVDISINETSIAKFFETDIELGDIRIEGSSIQTINSDTDLRISVPGTGVIVLDDTLELPSVPHNQDPSTDPAFPVNGVRLYSKNQNLGKSGLFISNDNSTRDELISTNRSILYSMIL